MTMTTAQRYKIRTDKRREAMEREIEREFGPNPCAEGDCPESHHAAADCDSVGDPLRYVPTPRPCQCGECKNFVEREMF